MSMMFDTPEGVAFVKAAARKGALELEIQGFRRSSHQQTAYSIVKEVYGFRGSRKAVLADLSEYIEAEIRLKKLDNEVFKQVFDLTQDLVDALTNAGKLDQPNFEDQIARGEANGAISNGIRQAMSDLFYVMIVRQNRDAREGRKEVSRAHG
jgi:hypothetical protein